MSIKKRIRPLMGIREIFSIPRFILIPALLVSCALIPLILIEGSLPASNAAGAALAAAVFAGLSLFTIIIPAINARILNQSGVEGTATVLKKEKRSRWVIASEPGRGFHNDFTAVTIEFIPQGAPSPMQLEVEVTNPGRYQQGKTVKIRYAASNPRLMKFVAE